MLLASMFAKPTKIRSRLSLFNKPFTMYDVNLLHFCLGSFFTFIFQGHMKIALIRGVSIRILI